MKDATLPRMVFDRARRQPLRTALMHKQQGAYRAITAAALTESVTLYGRALLALGIARGDRVGIMAPNGPQWVYADLAAQSCGGISVPIYHTEGISAMKHILLDAGCRFLFAAAPEAMAWVNAHRGDIPQLEHLVRLSPLQGQSFGMTLDDFLARAQQTPLSVFEQRQQAGGRDDPATLVYTSGTTGTPKGVILTHGNILANLEAVADLFPVGPDDICLSFLPLSHVFERIDGYYLMLRQGIVIAYAESLESVPVNLGEIRPTIMISVPRFYEKMYARIMQRILNGPWLQKQIFFGALRPCRRCVRRTLAGKKPGILLKCFTFLARRIIFRALHQRLGGRLRFFISGGAPLNRDIAEFFLAAGIAIYEGYGLTESAGGITVNTPDACRIETVGRPFKNVEIKIAGDGEVLLKGPGIFSGYWQRPDETRHSFDGEWFKTGDIGTVDEQGFLSIIDRKKDIIVTAGGENIAPQNIENLLRTDKFITNAFVYGDRRPYLTALVIPNFENLENFAKGAGIDVLDPCFLVKHPRTLDWMHERIEHLQSQMAPFQRIKRFALLSRDFSGDEITPTMKLRRNIILEKYRTALEAMYRDDRNAPHNQGRCLAESTDEP